MNIPAAAARGAEKGGGYLRASVDDMDFDELFHNESNGNSPQHPSARAAAQVSTLPTRLPVASPCRPCTRALK